MFKELIRKLDEYFSKDENELINNLQKTIKQQEKDLELCDAQAEDLYDIINDLEQELTILEKKLEGINLVHTSEKYEWRPRQKVLLRQTLNNFSKDTEKIGIVWNFLQELDLKPKYSSVDSLVYDVVLKCYNFVSDGDDYDTDMERFGVSEYWLTPQEAFDLYTSGGEGDCDDMSAFLYACIISALVKMGFESEIYRLKRWDVKRPIGHALLVWKNKNGLWKRIESTYYKNDFQSKWRDNSSAFTSVFAVTWHVFDESSEYKID